MYKQTKIIEDYGDRVLLQTQGNETKVVYKSLLHDFGELCNKYGLTKKSMAPFMRHLTEWERTNLYLLQQDGYIITKIERDYVLLDDEGYEVHMVSKKLVHRLKNMGYLRICEGDYVLNASKYK